MRESSADVKGYIESSIALYKLKAFRVGAKSAAVTVRALVLTVVFLLGLVFLSVAAAIGLGFWSGNLAIGFLIVGGFYMLLFLIAILIKDSVWSKPILRMFSKMLYGNHGS